jgi:exodeoxyribonuclease V gamma subunit
MQGWARLMLRLREDEDDDPGAREDEPFATGNLPKTLLLRDVFLDALGANWRGSEDSALLESLYRPRAEALARSGIMPVGLFRAADHRSHLGCLGAWCEAARERGLLDRGPYAVHRFGRAAENEPVDLLGPPLLLDVPLRATGGGVGVDGSPATVRVELYGRTEMVSAKQPGSLTCVTRDKPKDKDFLAGFLDAVVLSLIGHHDPAEYQVHLLLGRPGEKPEKLQRRLINIKESCARAYLTNLLSDMLSAPHAYLLPCEAVFKYLNKQIPVETTVEELKEDPRSSCSSRYGPVPNFALYDPPGDEEAEAMIESRFGLFRDCGGMVA